MTALREAIVGLLIPASLLLLFIYQLAVERGSSVKLVAKMVTINVPVSSRREVEYVITRLYAAGLELQSARERQNVAPQKRALISSQVRRLGGLIDDIRTSAVASSTRSA